MAKSSLADVRVPALAARKPKRTTPSVSLVGAVLASVNKRLGNEAAAVALNTVPRGQHGGSVTGWVKTGIWALDWIIGDWRGIPLGRISVIWGDEGCGKSSLAQYLIGRFQRKTGGLALYLDYDNALDAEQLERGGIDLNRVIQADVVTLEEGYDAIKGGIEGMYGVTAVMRAGGKRRKKSETVASKSEPASATTAPMLVVFDSVSAAGARDLHEEEDAESYHVGTEARVVSAQNKKLRQWIRHKPIHVILLAESRANIGGVGRFAPQSKMAGARSLRFTPSTILKVGNAGAIRKGERVVGHRMYVSVDRKARLGRPGRKAEIVISYSHKPGQGGPNAALSNLLFLDEVVKIVKRKGEAGITLRGLEDVVGTFRRSEWPSVMATHEKAILTVVRERLADDTE
jgi:RecA/RadA recombinase